MHAEGNISLYLHTLATFCSLALHGVERKVGRRPASINPCASTSTSFSTHSGCAAAQGQGQSRSPRHTMSRNSRNEGVKHDSVDDEVSVGQSSVMVDHARHVIRYRAAQETRVSTTPLCR
jgi:hypothetical protein